MINSNTSVEIRFPNYDSEYLHCNCMYDETGKLVAYWLPACKLPKYKQTRSLTDENQNRRFTLLVQ